MHTLAIRRWLRSVLAVLCASGFWCCQAQPPERAYSLKLTSFVPEPNHASGMLVEARINGGPTLHLLLDSGAAHITLNARASARSAIAAVVGAHLVGVGESPAKSGIAAVVDAGPLQFRDCRVDVAPSRLARGIDGVIPLSLFGGFLIRLDLPDKTLDL